MSNKAIKYRIYPSEGQKILFAKTFGCCRKVWNLMLSDREEAYRKDKTSLRPTPAQYKDEYPFLREVDSLALANVQLDLQEAYKRFFTVKGIGHPKFKSRKHSRNSYTTNNQNGTIALLTDEKAIKLPKIGRVKAVLHRKPGAEWKLKSATVSMERDGGYYCSVLFEFENRSIAVPHPELNAIGLDYKSDGLYADSNGHVPGSPKEYRKAQGRRTHAQRALRHKTVGSNNYNKQQRKVAKIERHAANKRKDFLHKESLAIAKQYDLVAVESLDMKALANKGFGNGKATLDNGYGIFLSMLEYKMHDRGKVFIRVDKWFPSSQLCSECGYRNSDVKVLSVHSWICPECGAIHDRDINAAVNIRNEGIRLYLQN